MTHYNPGPAGDGSWRCPVPAHTAAGVSAGGAEPRTPPERARDQQPEHAATPPAPCEQPAPQEAHAAISFLPCQFHFIYDFSLVRLSDWSEHVSELVLFFF